MREGGARPGQRRRSPYALLLLARVREIRREPEVLFWIFGFPFLLALALGIAFRNKPAEVVRVGVLVGPATEDALLALRASPALAVESVQPAEAGSRLRLGKVALVVVPGARGAGVEYRFDPTRPESQLARQVVDDALQRAAGRRDPVPVRESRVTEPGARYIDFLIPGLLGMSIMSGGMWGVGFALVEMRSRNLLKRFTVTPMRRTEFLAALMTSRVILVSVQLVLLLLFGKTVFHMVVRGSLILVTALSVLGAFAFAGLGLLVASRARKIETVSGLMNLVMLPMFVFSGVFFSSERFPDALQPWVRALPLTALNDALRAAILEGAGPGSQAGRIAVLAAWGLGSFVLALRLFRWT